MADRILSLPFTDQRRFNEQTQPHASAFALVLPAILNALYESGAARPGGLEGAEFIESLEQQGQLILDALLVRDEALHRSPNTRGKQTRLDPYGPIQSTLR